jgi:hypothetical protein
VSSGLQSSIILWEVPSISKKCSTTLDCLNLNDNYTMFLLNTRNHSPTTCPMTKHHIPKDLNPQINIYKFNVHSVTIRWSMHRKPTLCTGFYQYIYY